MVRHLISIPAGTGKMNIVKFSVYTVLGAGLWNAFLAYVGFVLKENWAQVRKYLSAADVLVIIALVGAVAYFIYRRFRNSRMQEG